ncbi:MAG: T9SS type A sorting domain-containing protein [Bacteroidota bacterium]
MRSLCYVAAALLLTLTALPSQAQLVRSETISKAIAEATSLAPDDAPPANPIVAVSAGGLDPTSAYGDYNSGTSDVFGFWTVDGLTVESLGAQPTAEEFAPLTISATFGPDGEIMYAVILDSPNSTYYLAALDPLASDNGYELIGEITLGEGIFGNPVGIQYDKASDTAVLFTLGCGTLDDPDETYVQSFVGAIDLETAEVEVITELRDSDATGAEGDEGVCIIGVSWDPVNNIIFASDISGDDIVKIDVATGELIERDRYEEGVILADVTFVQDSSWDPNTQKHYVVPFSVDRNDAGDITAIGSPMFECESSAGCVYLGDLELEFGWVEPLGTSFPDFSPVSAEEDVARALDSFTAYPNPTAEGARIAYELGSAGSVQIDLYNVLGQHVRSVVSGTQAAGVQQAFVRTADLPGGVYLLRFETENSVTTRSITVLD